jgi:xanthine dehydrogenase iron-sulfur cluster and FAD-binding subunit A
MQEWNNNLEFWINGEKRTLNNVDVNTTLLEHLRINEELTGSKKSCGQGGNKIFF